MSRTFLAVLLAVVLAGLLVGCGASANRGAAQGASVDPARGKAAIEQYGCGGCHRISGVAGADGEIGPSLRGFGGRRTVAGEFPNTPQNAARWIRHPQEIHPGTLMPDLGVSVADARAIVAYLETR